jgi:hypothetical protein
MFGMFKAPHEDNAEVRCLKLDKLGNLRPLRGKWTASGQSVLFARGKC